MCRAAQPSRVARDERQANPEQRGRALARLARLFIHFRDGSELGATVLTGKPYSVKLALRTAHQCNL